ncbi:MAG: UMP kinase [Clostridia bacterium]|nr:UMP kinase [Clostridia bacterium]
MNDSPKYKRILLKLSGEALSEGSDGIFNYDILDSIAAVVKKCCEKGVQTAIVVGAGNIWRGRQGGGMERSRADCMGMLATTINSLAILDSLEHAGIDARVMTALEMTQVAEPFVRDKAVRHLEKGRVVIFAGGTGCPYFSTDTAGALRAAEINADAILMAKNIDGVYTADPKTDPTAVRLDEITYDEILSKGLRVIDSTAASFCRDNGIPTLIFALSDPDNILRTVMGENTGTVVK